MTDKKSFIEVIGEINKMLAENGITAREALHIARELETNATISLTISQLIKPQEDKKSSKG